MNQAEKDIEEFAAADQHELEQSFTPSADVEEEVEGHAIVEESQEVARQLPFEVGDSLEGSLLEELGGLPPTEAEVRSADSASEEGMQITDANLLQLEQELQTLPAPEDKLQRVLQFMESALAAYHPPKFKQFWQVRELCFPLFKQNLPQATRTLLWDRYAELSKEARRLKEVLDEQSAFASEQIDIAIQGVESDLATIAERLESLEPDVGLAINAKALASQNHWYAKVQYELNFLNSQAARINALRKELIKTDMRARKKNHFFQRLSALGDRVFPKRKELIQQLSVQFSKDIASFVSDHFSADYIQAPFYFLREEIKALQSTAKILTLNAQVFRETRLQLSTCWDRVKELEKEKKKEHAQQRILFQEQVDVLKAQAEPLRYSPDTSTSSPEEAMQKLDALVASLRSLQWSREDIKDAKQYLFGLRESWQALLDKEESERQQVAQEKQRLRREKVEELRKKVIALRESSPQESAEQLLQAREDIVAEIQKLGVTKSEKQEFDRLLKPLNDLVLEKKEQALLVLSDDQKQAYQQLRTILAQRQQRRQEIKDSLEQLRKAAAVSGLDFERAINCQAQIQEEKERLEKVQHGVLEMEQRLAEFERNG